MRSAPRPPRSSSTRSRRARRERSVLAEVAVYNNLVDGKRVAPSSGETYEKCNPWEPDEVVGRFPLSDATDVDAAVTAAARALESWSRLPFQGRAAVLNAAAALVDERAETIAADMTREMGK